MVRSTEPPGTRDRLVAAMSDALQRRGYHGVGLNELLAEAQAPKGVLYHHFPGGKTELAIAAIRSAVARLTSALDQLIASGADPVQALGAWMAGAQKQLEKGRFERGCPLATVALESTAEDETIRREIASGFAAIRDRLSQALVSHGVTHEKAGVLSTLIVSAYEGALMQARVAGSLDPMTETATALLQLVRTELAAAKGPR